MKNAGRNGMTQLAVAKELGISIERVRQIEQEALRKLRRRHSARLLALMSPDHELNVTPETA